ncbi:transcriptional regulator SUPERMAN-like [Cornus florida]|uniref:transcriptional regulator SUPERMAN-like n=1 Tax=Cornus florida TaxID=4283 RepID=UPI00289B0DB1|nr:transcriptional regulator SUPERMAN-like [Cornus florida]
MERHSFSTNLKGRGLCKKNKDSWECNGNSATHGGGDLQLGDQFSWPPRSYTCSFCKREFRSAQSLGGHMNVHRRDRARLRQYSPPRDIGHQYPLLNLNLNLQPNTNPNPNPNFSSSSQSSSPPTRFPSFTSTLPPLVSPSHSTLSPPSFASPSYQNKKWGMDSAPVLELLSKKGSDLTKTKTAKALFVVREFDGFTEEDGCNVLNKTESHVRLDLEIGVLDDCKDELDLELRLGYS